MKKQRHATVISSQRLTPNMQRIVLGGEELADFPPGQESGYIKLIFGDDPDTRRMRTYTVRAFDPDKPELVVDFALHDDSEGDDAGLASHWAQHADPGTEILVGGPGDKKLVNMDADWFLLAGDMTALPAISCNLEQMPRNARGYAVIEVVSEADRQPLDAPAGIAIHWVINPHPGSDANALLHKIRTLPWLDGKPSIWAACEFSAMRALRKFFKQEKQVQRDELYVSSYWKLGRSEDQHKIDKREDAQAEESVSL